VKKTRINETKPAPKEEKKTSKLDETKPAKEENKTTKFDTFVDDTPKPIPGSLTGWSTTGELKKFTKKEKVAVAKK